MSTDDPIHRLDDCRRPNLGAPKLKADLNDQEPKRRWSLSDNGGAETSPVEDNLFLISEVRIQDFRLIKDIWIPLRPTNVLIGENNTGKTSLLEALAIALGQRQPTEDDLLVDASGVRASVFVVDVKISPWSNQVFEDAVREIFGETIQGVAEGLEYVAIRFRAQRAPEAGGVSFRRRFLQGWARTRAEAESLTEITSLSVSPRVLSVFAFHLLDAARDISTELRSRRSRWGRLMSDLGIEDSLREEIETQLAEISGKIVDSSSILEAVRAELGKVRNALGSAVEEIEITPLPGRLEELVGSVDVNVRAPGAAALPMRQQGLGSRNIASLTVFRSFVNLRLSAELDIRPQAISAFEEPEAHLHPQAQRSAFELLTTMPGQKLISTHSPYVASVTDVFDLRVFRRESEGISVRYIEEQFQADTEVVERARQIFHAGNGEVLFARSVILVEGESELGALTVFADSYWETTGGASGRGVSFININGAQNLKAPIVALERLGIPWIALVDGDAEGESGLKNASEAIGRDLASSPDVIVPSKDGTGYTFDAYLVQEGFRPQIEQAISNISGADALQEYKDSLHGKPKKGGGLRDYESEGWEDRLVLDWIARHKSSYGWAFAKVCVGKDNGDPMLPAKIRAVLLRADAQLGAK